MKVIIINGPNLNLLGVREKSIYGNISFEEYFAELVEEFPNLELEQFQSNIEGELIDKLQEVGFTYDAILLNAGGYTHTSVAISDCIKSVKRDILSKRFPFLGWSPIIDASSTIKIVLLCLFGFN